MDWNEVPARVVCRIVADCDGRSIFAPEHFTERGAPRELIDRAVAFHGSDFVTAATVIIRCQDGKAVGGLTGVYDLDSLYQIALALGVRYKRKRGSRSQAQALKEVIHRHYVAGYQPYQITRGRDVYDHGGGCSHDGPIRW